MKNRFVSALHVDGAPRPLTREQRDAWDTRSGFVGSVLPDRPVTFWELVELCEVVAGTRREEARAPEEIAMQLVDLLEVDLARLVADRPRRRGPRGTQQ